MKLRRTVVVLAVVVLAVVVLAGFGLVFGASVGPAVATSTAGLAAARTTGTAVARPARVLLIGDSILDQEGSAAAFLLRQWGVDANVSALWGSGLLGVTQYDYGKTKPAGGWLHKAKTLVASFDPDAVGVYMNHNYWPPYPHDAAGRSITDLWSASAQKMIAQQARALITILRARGAKVFFISPIPAGTISNPDPSVWNPIWHGYLPALRAMHVAVANTAVPIEAANGLRAETKASCNGTQQRVRPPADVHLTRFGAGRVGTALAKFVAALVHAQLHANTAPGDTTAALVPTPDGAGYWLVGCNGSVYHFGDAAHLGGALELIAGHHGVVGAVATPTGHGLWLVTADGTIVTLGDARALAFTHRAQTRVVAASGAPGATAVWATTASGAVLVTAASHFSGGLGHDHLNAKIVGIAATRDGRGYWLVGTDGGVFGFGDAQYHGSTAPLKRNAAIVGLAPTADSRGYWLVGSDGGVFTFGDAQFHGTGSWRAPPASALEATPGPTIGIAATQRLHQGYWVFGTTGRVSPLGAVGHYGGDNNLALLTQ